MKDNKIKRIAGTVVSAIVILALVGFAIALSDYTFSENQLATLNVLIIICLCSIAYCFIVGEITQNFSQMDKLWSILPVAYSWVVAVRGGMNIRLIIYALIVTTWGVRLTINFARKGAYKLKFWEGEEDYRWSIVRKNPFFKHKLAWSLFDLLFISLYQNALVLAICLPSLAIMESTAPLAAWDIVAAILALLFLALETVADEYQWKFHQTKRKLLEEKGSLEDLPAPYDLGFNTFGPWGYMRHPNYLGEQGMWLSLYIFAVGAGITNYAVFHWSVVGPLMLVLLFMGSSTLGEAISSGKYPMYGDYIDSVYKYVPIHRYKYEKSSAEEDEISPSAE